MIADANMLNGAYQACQLLAAETAACIQTHPTVRKSAAATGLYEMAITG
jgi:hypothetical protein